MLSLIQSLFRLTFYLLIAGSLYAIVAWQVSPVFRENAYVFALFSEVNGLQELAAKELREFPSKKAAVSLLAFLNFKAPGFWKSAAVVEIENQLQAVELAIAGEAPAPAGVSDLQAEKLRLIRSLRDEQTNALQEATGNNKLANRALWSLALLSGETFGTDYDTDNPYSWRNLNPDEWAEVMPNVNYWAAATFAADALDFLPDSAEEASSDDMSFEITIN